MQCSRYFLNHPKSRHAGRGAKGWSEGWPAGSQAPQHELGAGLKRFFTIAAVAAANGSIVASQRLAELEARTHTDTDTDTHTYSLTILGTKLLFYLRTKAWTRAKRRKLWI